MEWETDEALGRLLEAIRTAPLGNESVPDVAGIDRDESMELIEELIRRGWVDAEYMNRGDGRLASVWNPRVTPIGEAALTGLRLRSLSRPSTGSGATRSFEEKGRMRLAFMRRLYEVTDGSREAMVAAGDIGGALGWDESDTDKVVEYLAGERLLEVVAFGPQICITHQGVVEVEEALGNPGRSTRHFPSINIVNVETMNQSQIQQAGVANEQNLVLGGPKLEELAALIKDVRELLPDLELLEDDRSELEAEIDTVDRQLHSPRPKRRAIRDSLSRAGELLVRASIITGSAEHVAGVIDRLHRALPGL